MRALVVPAALALLTGLALPSDAPDARPRVSTRVEAEAVPDEILVTFREGVAEADGRASVGAAGHAVVRRFRYDRDPGARLNRRYLVRLGPGRRLEEALQAIRRRPDVEAAQPNFIYHAMQSASDPYYFLQWAQENTGNDWAYTLFGLAGPDPRVSGADMAAASARALYAGLPMQEVVVGVLDSGIDAGHPDLFGTLWVNAAEIPGNGLDDDHDGYIDDVQGWDFAYNDSVPADGDGHGTHVSGVIAAKGDNGVGVIGTAPNVRLMVLKFLDDTGSGTTADAIDAILYGVSHGARVLNNSWGGGPYEEALRDAIVTARNAGVLFVVAAGNEGANNDVTPGYPAGYDLDNIISVAASTPWRDRSDFSNYGVLTVDLAAPGEEIISTTPTQGQPGLPETAWQIAFPSGYPAPAGWSGTSMATPAVSGAAAILYGLGDELWPATWTAMSPIERMTAVKARILERASRWAALAGSSVTEGHLNLYNLVESDSTPPAPVGSSFEVVARGARFVTLRWTATGDDGTAGRANYYDLRSQPGSSIDFATATPADGVWTPNDPGAVEHYTLSGLQPDSTNTLGLEVVDNAGNRSAPTELTVQTLPETLFFTDDMEAGPNGWSATAGNWALTTESSSSPAHAWSDSPGGLYAPNQDAILTSPEIPTDGSALSLSFMQRHALETGGDFGYLEARARVAGVWGAWTTMLALTGTDVTWTRLTASLPVSGERVQVRFRLISDSSVNRDGWYVDDVSVTSAAGPAVSALLFEDRFDGDDCSAWARAGMWGCESNTLSDSPGVDYPLNYRASAVLIGPLDLAGALGAEISFRFAAFDYESGFDFLYCEYSLDGTSWRTLERYTGSRGGTVVLGLDALIGQPSVFLRFRSASDYGISSSGARLDDVQVRVRRMAGCLTDSACDDGLFCNGVETCDTGTGVCEAGTPPTLDDGVPCTADACDESSDSVVHLPIDALCDDGRLCTADACDPLLGCTNIAIPGCSDADNDGIKDAADNCVAAPNGPAAGTCVSGAVGTPCHANNECLSPLGAGLCSLDQEDLDQDGAGDACDPDQDGDGSPAALGDCDDRAALIHPGAPEVCDGLDNDCDGAVDNLPAPPEVAGLNVAGSTLSWTPIAGAATYDIVAGRLEGLAAAGLKLSTTGCVAEDLPPVSVTVQTQLPVGSGVWYLVRGSYCGVSGSYGAGNPPQPQSRDQAIAASGRDCAP